MAGHCEPNCPVAGGLYIYDPNLGGNAFLLAVYAALIPIVLYIGFRYRTRVFAVALSSGLLFELLGFIGRVLLHGSRGNEGYFFLAQFGTVLGPTLMSIAIFLILPHLFSVYGENSYPFRPHIVSFIFHGFAALAFLLELIGVVLVAYGFDGIGRTKGADVAASGLAIQSVLLLTFSGLHFWATLGLSTGGEGVDEKYSQVYSSPRFKWFQLVLQVDTLLLAVYSIYRLVEFSGGVASQLFQNEAAFMIIGGAFPLIVCLLLTAFHPGRAFGDAWSGTSPRAHTRRGPPEPIDTGLPIHHRYDPEIRKQISPMSGKNQPGSLSPPQPPAGSPGLPANPKPVMSPTSMHVSMTEPSTRSNSAQDQYGREPYAHDQYTHTHDPYTQDQYTTHVRQERQSSVPKSYIVRDDELW